MADYHEVNRTDNRWEEWDARGREEVYGRRNYSGNWGGVGADGGSYGGGYSGGDYRGGRRRKSYKGLVAAIVIPLVLIASVIVLFPLFSTTEQPKDDPVSALGDPVSALDVNVDKCNSPQCYTVPAPPEPASVPDIPYVQPPTTQLVTEEIEAPHAYHDELVNYALELINKDREAYGLQPVKLSNNQAAQVFAEDNLKQGTISHWLSNGEKPYMTYTRLGGTGYVSQNIASAYYTDIERCKSGYYYCLPINPMDNIKSSEYGMMFEDYVCCQNGHRDNILAPEHTDVSIGIAYDDYGFYMVQNFEDNYINFNQQINNGLDTRITLSGDFHGKITQVLVSYDPLPTPLLYENHKDDHSYMMGIYVAGVVGSSYEYYSSFQTIYAYIWGTTSDGFTIQFDLSSVLSKPGVYTVSVLGDSGDYKNIQLASHSFVYR